MKCHKPDLMSLSKPATNDAARASGKCFPDTLIDYLTGREIPFSNRDNIRQSIVKFLIEKKEFLKTDLALDREIRFDLDGTSIFSRVDIAVCLNDRTIMVLKSAPGSLVTRQRQIIAAARLLEEYVVPFAVVTNGKDIELLDSVSEKVLYEGFGPIPSKTELLAIIKDLHFRSMRGEKKIYEQRILSTYDSIASPANRFTG